MPTTLKSQKKPLTIAVNKNKDQSFFLQVFIPKGIYNGQILITAVIKKMPPRTRRIMLVVPETFPVI